jgi:hypothetical protein
LNLSSVKLVLTKFAFHFNLYRYIMVRECVDGGRGEKMEDGEEARLVLGGSAGGGGLASSPVVPLVGMVGVIVARAAGWLTLNDALTRGALFIPLFTSFVMRVHTQTVYAVGRCRLNQVDT